MKITVLKESIDVSMIKKDIEHLMSVYGLLNEPQISLTSLDGNDDWYACNGSISRLEYPEEQYCVLNTSLKNTIVGRLISEYKQYFRWRLLKLMPGNTYTIHSDSSNGRINKRIHIPVISNNRSFFCFYDKIPIDGQDCIVSHHHLDPGKIYEVDTTGFHTAVNYGNTVRYHIVGVRYEENTTKK